MITLAPLTRLKRRAFARGEAEVAAAQVRMRLFVDLGSILLIIFGRNLRAKP
jgi:hypothetical protein